MNIELKIMTTCLVVWFILHLSAFPDTGFAEWGTRKFKTYKRFLSIIAEICFIPFFLTGLYWLWSL